MYRSGQVLGATDRGLFRLFGHPLIYQSEVRIPFSLSDILIL